MLFRVAALCLLTAPAFAEDLALADDLTVDDEGGTLNPPELSLGAIQRQVDRGQADMMTCAQGYYITKSGRHEMARELFEMCAEAGWTGAMTWMSQLDNNGLGAEYNPEASTDWDRRAAEGGDPVGKFNLGLAMIRGHGVTQDVAAGRRLIDQAAETGLPIAERMVASGYDPEEVTPDADNWKYAPRF
ncbi:MAG: sel1 repeat family protein [Pseudomonadota bacterium]